MRPKISARARGGGGSIASAVDFSPLPSAHLFQDFDASRGWHRGCAHDGSPFDQRPPERSRMDVLSSCVFPSGWRSFHLRQRQLNRFVLCLQEFMPGEPRWESFPRVPQDALARLALHQADAVG